MRCPFCNSKKLTKKGRVYHKSVVGKQRFYCLNCGRYSIKAKR